MTQQEKIKRKMGRPAIPGKRVIVKLGDDQIARIKVLGDGSFTKGLRKILRFLED